MITKSQIRISNFEFRNPKFWINSLILSATFIFCFAEIFTTLISKWYNNAVYSHGFLIPFISLYFIWMGRERLKQVRYSPNYPIGLTILSIGLLMNLTGHAGGVQLVQELSLIITIIGMVILILGTDFFKALLFPILFLLFMLTFWGNITERLQMPFQIFTAAFSAKLLKLMGITAYRESVYIELPNITLEVAKICSGVNYLVAVAAIGIPLSYITIKSWSRRIILVSGALIMAVLANGLRVSLIGALAYYNLAGDLHGPYHVLHAMFVSVFGYIVLFVGALVLSDKGKSIQVGNEVKAAPYPKLQLLQQGHTLTFPMLLAVGILLIAGSYINFYHPAPVPLKIDLNRFPYKIGEWKGIDAGQDDRLFKALGIDRELARNYRTAEGRNIRLYIGYYESQKQGKELINEKSNKLYINASEMEIALSPNETMKVNRLVKREGNKNSSTIFWYDLNGRTVVDKYKAKIYTTWDALIMRRTNGAVIVLSWESEAAEENQPYKYAEDFIRNLTPVLQNYLP